MTLSKRRRAVPLWIGSAITAVWAIAVAGYFLASDYCPGYVLRLNPVDFASFLGGILSPLAVGWLVVGYWYQSKALEFQEEQLRESLGTSTKLVTAFRVGMRPSYKVWKPNAGSASFYVKNVGNGAAMNTRSKTKEFLMNAPTRVPAGVEGKHGTADTKVGLIGATCSETDIDVTLEFEDEAGFRYTQEFSISGTNVDAGHPVLELPDEAEAR